MKRLLTYVIAAVFAWCLFVYLPVSAMNEPGRAFSDGSTAPTATARPTPPSGAFVSPSRQATLTAVYAISENQNSASSGTPGRRRDAAPNSAAPRFLKIIEVSDHRRDAPDLTRSRGRKDFDLPPNPLAENPSNKFLAGNPSTNIARTIGRTGADLSVVNFRL